MLTTGLISEAAVSTASPPSVDMKHCNLHSVSHDELDHLVAKVTSACQKYAPFIADSVLRHPATEPLFVDGERYSYSTVAVVLMCV